MSNEEVSPLVFLSYAREDQEQVEDLYQQLLEVGLRPWMDVHDIPPGALWKREIMINVRNAAFFLACLSHHSVRKAGRRSVIREELTQALEVWRQKEPDEIFLIPVRLADCDLPDLLAQFQWVDLFTERGLRRLLDTLVARSEHKGLATPGLERLTTEYVEEKPTFTLEALNRYLERLADFKRPRLVVEGINTESLAAHLNPPFGGRDYLGALTIPEGERCLYILDLSWWQGTNGSEDITDQIVDILAFHKSDFLKAIEAKGDAVQIAGERIRHDLFWEDSICAVSKFQHLPDVPLKLRADISGSAFEIEHTSQVKSVDHPYQYHVDWVQEVFKPPR